MTGNNLNPRHQVWRTALCLGLWAFTACVPTPSDVKEADEPLVIYPDYRDVTVPCNIAPLNFMLRDERADALSISISDASGQEVASLHTRGRKAVWDADTWHALTAAHSADSLFVTVTARTDGEWRRYPSFGWFLSADSLDAYLTYRLIEPGYEVWDKVCIEERCTESFDTRLLADGRELGNRCMNCHTHGGPRGEYSFFHLRGQGGGTILSRNGQLRKVTLRNAQMQSGAVYGDFHPSGRYAAYSTNVIIPAFHTQANRRLEVYDTTGDLCVADFDSCRLDNYTDVRQLFSFPCFSADGRWIYYCAAPNPCGDTIPTARELLPEVTSLHYSLLRMPFDAETGRMDPSRREVIYDAESQGGSVSLPKCSPDGRFLLFCLSGYGTFPIWHRETRLCLLPLDGDTAEAPIHTGIYGTYHSWSHNSKWIAFASKREDGQYGRTFFVHIEDVQSNPCPTFTSNLSTKNALTLPQADPEHDDMNLRSYNIPDLSTQAMPFGQDEVKLMLEKVTAEPFN